MDFYTFLQGYDFDDERARSVIQFIRRIYNNDELKRYYKPHDPNHPRPSESTIEHVGPSFWHWLGMWQGYCRQNEHPLDKPPDLPDEG